VQLFLGTTDIFDSSRLIFESDGNIQAGKDHEFMAALNNDSTDPPLLPSEVFLTLELRMDFYPGEISVQLRMDNEETSINREAAAKAKEDTVIFFRPPEYYKDRVNEIVVERISIPGTSPGASRQFSFIISDRYGDGLCCSWVGDKPTGYTLYEGDPSDGQVIVDSKFESSGREVKVFTVHGGDANIFDAGGEYESETSVEIKVTITLDVYPDETGFFIEDSLQRRVVDVPPGTYKDQNKKIEEIVTLYPGLYTFTITDIFGDGLTRADSFYQLDLVNDNVGRPHLLTGNGAFTSQESQVFLIEGDAAKYPLWIHIPLGVTPQDFGFAIYRLDLVESNAVVASRARGSYELANEDALETLLVTEGGLYRIIFENTSQGINGDIRINMGSTNPNIFKGIEYTINAEDTGNLQRGHAKFYAGAPFSLSTSGDEGEVLTLRMNFDRFPSEVEWILLSNNDISTSSRLGFMDREIVAFGPEVLYDQELENKVFEETIMIPEHLKNHRFTLLVTDSGNDGTISAFSSSLRCKLCSTCSSQLC